VIAMVNSVRTLPPDVADLLVHGSGFLTTDAARSAGVDSRRLRRLTSDGVLTRLAHGCYVLSARIKDYDKWELHRTTALAYALSCGPGTHLAGWSAVAAWRLRTLGPPPELPVVVRPTNGRSGSTPTPHATILRANVPAEHVVAEGPWTVVSPSWAALDIARTAPVPTALVVADSALRAGADLTSALPHFTRWKGGPRARWVAAMADAGAESSLETLGRFACLEFDLPVPVANAWVGIDRPVRRVDGLWPYHRSAFEADGAIKYNNRADAAQIVRAQNDREFELRRIGLDFARFGWDEAYPRRDPVAAKFRALLADNPPRDEPIRWWKDVPGVGPVEPDPDDWPSPHPLGLILPAGWNRPRGRRR
jgi:Transcriptional regulator, AbiEi antitoxin